MWRLASFASLTAHPARLRSATWRGSHPASRLPAANFRHTRPGHTVRVDDAVELLIERVLRAVECVPAGRVVSYGDIAELVGTSARRVGSIMGAEGSGIPWWRVTNASGRLPEHLTAEASLRWRREGTPVGDGRCMMSQARADLTQWAADYEMADPASRLTSARPDPAMTASHELHTDGIKHTHEH